MNNSEFFCGLFALLCFFCIIFGSIIGGSLMIHHSKEWAAQSNNKTNGTITAIVYTKRREVYDTHITYTASNGYNYTLADSSWSSDKVGDIVTIAYRKDDPRDAARNDNDGSYIFWGVVLIGFGVACVLLIAFAIVKGNPNADPAHNLPTERVSMTYVPSASVNNV